MADLTKCGAAPGANAPANVQSQWHPKPLAVPGRAAHDRDVVKSISGKLMALRAKRIAEFVSDRRKRYVSFGKSVRNVVLNKFETPMQKLFLRPS